MNIIRRVKFLLAAIVASRLLIPSSSSSTDNEDISWGNLSSQKRKELKESGWNREAWDRDDPKLMTFYNEVELGWYQLPDDRREYWIELDVDETMWEQMSEKAHDCIQIKSDPDSKPIVIKMPIKSLSSIDMSYFQNFEGKHNETLGVSEGTPLVSDETKAADISLDEFIAHFHEGGTKYKLSLEGVDPEKAIFPELGRVVTTRVKEGLVYAELKHNYGMFKEEWKNLDPSGFDWSLFMGSKGTQTPMHFDTDLFNFLYVVEGRKRIVLIPNDQRTESMFKVKEFYSGSAWTGLDILHKDFHLPEGAVEVIIGPNEGLIIPYRWWHAVQNVENTLAYGFRVSG